MLSAAERDRKFAALIAEKANRVLALKTKFKLAGRRAPKPSQKTIDKLQRALWELTEEVRLETATL